MSQYADLCASFLEGEATVLLNSRTVIAFGPDDLYLLALWYEGESPSGNFWYAEPGGGSLFEIAFRFVNVDIVENADLGRVLVFFDATGQFESAPLKLFPPRGGIRFWVNANANLKVP